MAALVTLIGLSGCSESGDKAGSTVPPAPVTEVAVPTPAPLPPPPKPPIRSTRPAAKPAAKAAPNGEQATNGTAEKADTTTPFATESARASEPPSSEPAADHSAEQQLALRSPDARQPIRLIGLDRNATTAVLGAPAEERQVAVARVWDYRGPDCRLAVYFYLDTGRNDFYALHYEIDGPEAGPDGEQHCLQRIRDARGN